MAFNVKLWNQPNLLENVPTNRHFSYSEQYGLVAFCTRHAWSWRALAVREEADACDIRLVVSGKMRTFRSTRKFQEHDEVLLCIYRVAACSPNHTRWSCHVKEHFVSCGWRKKLYRCDGYVSMDIERRA
ncbi:hypothetical protein D5086_011344 [Populus alba]|uniref:Uncharacterized protein n=1 Tax=Populus alba TaxID=43335 RepID=A0ACC4CDK7_POPAL